MSIPKMFSELHMRSDLHCTVARVWRKWYMFSKANPNELSAICFLLIDAEGQKIGASVMLRAEHERFDRDIEAGKIYEFDTFTVSPNSLPFRPTTHQFMLKFGPQTSYYEESADIPVNAYTFMPISDILALPVDADIQYLIDVIGFVKCMGQLEQSRSQANAKHWLRMILQDEQDNEIECVLFGDCASDAALAQDQMNDTAVVAVINLARISWNDQKRQIASSYGATQILFNPKLPQVESLLQSVQDRSTPITTQFNQSMTSQRSRISIGESLHSEPLSTLDMIPSKDVGDPFTVRVELGKLESKHGWHYDGCAKCSSKVKPLEPNNPNSPLYCHQCRKKPYKVEKKMKLTYVVTDETDTATITFWDKLATQFIGKTLDELKMTLEPRKRANGVPTLLDDQMGKNLLVQLKKSPYNKDNPGSSVNVCEFTVCQDLIGQFDAASSEGQPIQRLDSQNTNISKTDTSVDIGGASQSIDLTADDSNVVSLNDDTPLAQVKGKRRNTGGSRGQKDVQSSSISSKTSARSEERLLKTIKQEKN